MAFTEEAGHARAEEITRYLAKPCSTEQGFFVPMHVAYTPAEIATTLPVGLLRVARAGAMLVGIVNSRVRRGNSGNR